jgi:hypothetical protein
MFTRALLQVLSRLVSSTARMRAMTACHSTSWLGVANSSTATGFPGDPAGWVPPPPPWAGGVPAMSNTGSARVPRMPQAAASGSRAYSDFLYNCTSGVISARPVENTRPGIPTGRAPAAGAALGALNA